MTHIKVCNVSDLQPGEAIRVDAEPPIAVFNVDNNFYATEDTCTHMQASLAEGYVDEDVVECILHMAKFNIRTGAALTYPATRSLRTYPVAIENDSVFVNVDE
jgi:3-phenylpropionate/trans-cinnamate dioxygenase ferredoxin subunit